MDYITAIVIVGGIVAYEIMKIAIQKLFKNGTSNIKDLNNRVNEFQEKFVLYRQYEKDLDRIERKIDEIIGL